MTADTMTMNQAASDTDTPVLYHGLASTCSKKVRMTLYEKGVGFESRLLNLQKFEQHDPAYLALNPAGVVPTLVHRGVPITESSIIVEYVDESFVGRALSPADPAGRARMRYWLKFSDNVAYDAVFVSTWSKLSARAAKALTAAELETMLDRVPTADRRARWKKIATDGYTLDEMASAVDKMKGCLSRLEDGLRYGDWLAGPDLSLADIANIPFVDRIRSLHPELIEGGPHLRLLDWERRLRSRSTFARAFDFREDPAAEGLPNI